LLPIHIGLQTIASGAEMKEKIIIVSTAMLLILGCKLKSNESAVKDGGTFGQILPRQYKAVVVPGPSPKEKFLLKLDDITPKSKEDPYARPTRKSDPLVKDLRSLVLQSKDANLKPLLQEVFEIGKQDPIDALKGMDEDQSMIVYYSDQKKLQAVADAMNATLFSQATANGNQTTEIKSSFYWEGKEPAIPFSVSGYSDGVENIKVNIQINEGNSTSLRKVEVNPLNGERSRCVCDIFADSLNKLEVKTVVQISRDPYGKQQAEMLVFKGKLVEDY
jgi:hypothetical protein